MAKRGRGGFGNYCIRVDANLARVLRTSQGSCIKPSAMTKKLWSYVKSHKLGGKRR